jgi:ATP-dependent RNA helicase RhlE
MTRFETLNLTPTTLDAVAAMGFENATAIQARAIPPLAEGKDVIAQARTGTGKTAAFGIPLIERLARERVSGVAALVLVPTRELAVQVAEELSLLAKGTPVRLVTVYGGVGFNPQVEALRRPGTIVLVACPGRLLDHMNQGTARLDRVRVLVLDEADRMLDMGFLPDVERILRALPQDRQTSLFSATVPEPIRKLSQRFMRATVSVRAEDGQASTPLAQQFRIDVRQPQKGPALTALLAKEKPERAIVFTRTKHLARRLARNLERDGWAAVALQGNMSQAQRERAMGAFREGKAQVLVATDIASRGIDVLEVSHVVNYDIPHEADAYVHRVGRTGRMGRSGRAFTFVQPDQHQELRDVERAAGQRLEGYELGDLPEPGPEMPDPRRKSPFHAPSSQPARPARHHAQAGSRGRDPRGERRHEPQRGPQRHAGGNGQGARQRAKRSASGPREDNSGRGWW